MGFEIESGIVLSDNYAVLVHCTETGRTAAIDAASPDAYETLIARTGWQPDTVLITHHHGDHTDGIAALKAKYGARVIGPKGEADKIEGLDETVGGGDTVEFGAGRFEVIDTPGHTLGHISYFDPDGPTLFCADALFSLGCGRMFEGDPESMWEGLKRLRSLPDETIVYCGHEYTEANARYAMSVDGDNADLQVRAAEVAKLRAGGKPTVPFNLGIDKKANPFLRADDPALARRMGLSGAEPFEVFAAIRKGKDNF
jgi:hydroxyacylglutathione hydrolase